MKQLNTLISVVLLAAVAVLFFLVLKKDGVKKPTDTTPDAKSNSVKSGTIVYFEMDSVEQQYAYIKDVREKLKGREQSITNELNDMKKGYMNRIQQLQSKATNMSQQEGEAAQAEINQMQQNMQQKEARLSQELQDQQFKLMQDINKRIEDYLKMYNAQNKYAFILSHTAGDHIYYKDSTLNITSDLVRGLNETYKKQ